MQETASALVPPFKSPAFGEPDAAVRDLEPISPELVLVSPPDVARRARQLLSEAPHVYEVWAREGGGAPTSPVGSAAAEPIADAAPRVLGFTLAEVPAPRRRRVSRAATAAVVLVAVAVGAGGFVAGTYWDNGVFPEQARLAGHVVAVSPVGPVRNAPAASSNGRAVHAAKPRTPSFVRPASPKTPRSNKPRGTRPPPVKKAAAARKVPSARSMRPEKRGRLPANVSPKFVPSRVFTWAAQRGATSYVVRFFRNGRRVIQARATTPHLELPASFKFAAGRYLWRVIPVAGSSAKPRYGPPIVESTFVLTAATAAKAGS